MVVMGMTTFQIAEITLGFLWSIVFFASLYSMNTGPCKMLLKPVKAFTAVLAAMWVFVYYMAASAIFSQFYFGEPLALHAIGNGLLIVTVANFILLIFIVDKVLTKCGVE